MSIRHGSSEIICGVKRIPSQNITFPVHYEEENKSLIETIRVDNNFQIPTEKAKEKGFNINSINIKRQLFV